MPKLTIGRAAAAAGVNVETIRYYQRRHLLDEPSKPLGGYRRYSSETVKRVRFIKRAQTLGFTLEEISGMIGTSVKILEKHYASFAPARQQVVADKLSRIWKAKNRLVRVN